MAFGDLVRSVKASLASGETAITFTAPTSGNLVVVSAGRSATHSAGGAWSDPLGARIHDSGINVGNIGAAWWYFISNGTETAFTCTDTNEQGNVQVLLCEYAGLFAGSPLDVSAENAANLSSVVTSQTSGTTATTTQADALAVAMFAFARSDLVDGSRAYSNSFTESAFNDTSTARAGSSQARKVLSATGTVECTFSCTDTGDEMYGSIAVFKKASAGAYTLTADAGSYGMTGNTAALLWKHIMAAVAGSYSLTGNAVSLLFGHKIAATAGVYALTGNAIAFPRTYILVSAAGSYVLTGNAASLLFKQLLVAGAGAYVLTGNNVTLIYSGDELTHYTITADAGSYALVGNSVNLLFKRVMAALPGSYVLGGQNASLLFKRVMSADVGSYALNGQLINLLYGRKLSAVAGMYLLTGNNVNLLKNYLLPAEIGAYILTGRSISFGEILIAHYVYLIPAENRVFLIPVETEETLADRTFTIPRERRVIEVAHG